MNRYYIHADEQTFSALKKGKKSGFMIGFSVSDAMLFSFLYYQEKNIGVDEEYSTRSYSYKLSKLLYIEKRKKTPILKLRLFFIFSENI